MSDSASAIDETVDVLIVGGGPAGAALAAQLGMNRIRAVALEATDGVVRDARVHSISIRTMELARRWGIEDELRHCGWPLDRRQDAVWGTSLSDPEVARVVWPPIAEMSAPDFSPTFAQRCPQKWLNPILIRLANRQETAEVRTNWRMLSFEQDELGVTAQALDLSTQETRTIRAKYLVGCDGARSDVRKLLGIGSIRSEVWGTSAEAIIESPELAAMPMVASSGRFTLLEAGTMSVSLLPFDGRDQFRVTLMVHHDGGTEQDITDAVRKLTGRDTEFTFLSTVLHWTNRESVAERFRAGRVLLAGDAAHTMPTTGGFGMNTGLLDTVDLAWKLTAVIRGWGGRYLLESYEIERGAGARRTAALASSIYRDWLAIRQPLSETFSQIRGTEPGAESARQEFGAELLDVFRREFNAVGGALGYRYNDSPICVPDGSVETPDTLETYLPTARPGHLAPHAWLGDGTSTLDLFGSEFVVLHFGSGDQIGPLLKAARVRKVPLRAVGIDDPSIAELYQRRYVLVRPDGHVAWRADVMPDDAFALIDIVRGEISSATDPAQHARPSAIEHLPESVHS
jgi:2-polyprenyl-6-methoxyphenol hydroxylase-like FAD-dependent oxidoreductase